MDAPDAGAGAAATNSPRRDNQCDNSLVERHAKFWRLSIAPLGGRLSSFIGEIGKAGTWSRIVSCAIRARFLSFTLLTIA